MEKEKKKIKGRLLENFFQLHDNKTRKSTNVSFQQMLWHMYASFISTQNEISVYLKKLKQ